jgi:hypothetical protein
MSTLLQNFANFALYSGAVEGFGVKESMNALFVRGVGNYWRKALTDRKGYHEMREFVFNLSPFMRDKSVNPDYSLSDMHAKLFGEDSKVQEMAKGLMSGTDELTSIPMWIEAYNLALDEKLMEQDEAIRYADTLIDRTLGSGRKYDQAQITRGTELTKILTMFYTFLSTELNRWLSEVGNLTLNESQKARFVGFLASRLLIFVPVSALIAGKGPKDDDDPFKWWAKQIAGYPLSLFPGVREISDAALDNVLGMKGFGYRPSPAFAPIENGLRLVKDGSSWVSGDAETQQVLESLSRFSSTVLPYPDQFNAWFWNAYDISINGMEPQPGDALRRRPRKER